MASILENKESKIVVIDPSAPVRQMMGDIVKMTLGYKSVESRASVKDVLSYLESEHVDWILLPLMAEQNANAMHLLKICSEYPELKHIRISLFLTEDEQYVLPAAFELGLLSPRSDRARTQSTRSLSRQGRCAIASGRTAVPPRTCRRG